MTILIGLILLSSVSFLYYGITAITTKTMQAEFERYGLDKFRVLTGYLQLMGGIGLLTGLLIPLILSISSAGLALLMLFGFAVRIKIRDRFLLTMPSFLFMLLNLYILLASVELL
jgi:uncharacterized membrane protein YphA (DoxX/SURF4 family)